MEKSPAEKKKLLKELNQQLKTLQTKLVEANQAAGLDEYIDVKVTKNQAHFTRIKTKGEKDRGEGDFFMQIAITAKKDAVFIPISIASGKKPTGFVYQIEGTDGGSISTAKVDSRGEGVLEVTLGTLHYAKIPPNRTASLRLQIEIKGKINQTYKVIINRINYKLSPTDTRYRQYLKEIISDQLKFA